jgi:site-specific recombinase XerD
MKPVQKRNVKRRAAKSVLRLPDLEVAKSSVLSSLSCPDAQRGYRHAIDEFVEWYCSEPRLSFSKTVVVRYRMHLESRNLAPGTVNLRLGAVRRLAHEAADCGLLSADLAAGIRRVKGVKKLGVRLGNWLTAEQGQALWQAPDRERVKGKRDRALLALLLACGLRRQELAGLTVCHLQQREGHWAIVDLRGKAGHVRTIPVPDWVHGLLDDWTTVAGINAGSLFRRVSRAGRVWGEAVTEKPVWHVVKEFAAKIGVSKLAPHNLRLSCARLARSINGQRDRPRAFISAISLRVFTPHEMSSTGISRLLTVLKRRHDLTGHQIHRAQGCRDRQISECDPACNIIYSCDRDLFAYEISRASRSSRESVARTLIIVEFGRKWESKGHAALFP